MYKFAGPFTSLIFYNSVTKDSEIFFWMTENKKYPNMHFLFFPFLISLLPSQYH